MSNLEIDMVISLKLYSICHFRGFFNVGLSRTHYDTNSADRDKIIKSNRKAMNRNWSNQKANPALKTKARNK